MSGEAELGAAEGFLDPELSAEFPGLTLRWLTVGARVGPSTRELKGRLRALSNRFRGESVVAMRTHSIPRAYRVFFRQIGLDPDVTRVPSEQVAVSRLLHGRLVPRDVIADALLIAVVETGVPVWALDADAVAAGGLGIRSSAAGERLGSGEGGPPLAAGRLVVADSRCVQAVLFGELARGHVAEPCHNAARAVRRGRRRRAPGPRRGGAVDRGRAARGRVRWLTPAHLDGVEAGNPVLSSLTREEAVMELLDQKTHAQHAPLVVAQPVVEDAERAARRSLRLQIAQLERELSDAFVTAYRMGGLDQPIGGAANQPRVLDLGELERVRDELAERLRAARVTIAERADAQEASRLLLERMLLDPARYRFIRVSREALGGPGCGAWEVRPRLGLIGMLMGWWQVKLSSGCPLAGGRGSAPRP